METILKGKIREAIKSLYNSEVADNLIQIQETKKDFKGDFTVVVFPILRYSKNTPEQTGNDIGNFPRHGIFGNERDFGMNARAHAVEERRRQPSGEAVVVPIHFDAHHPELGLKPGQRHRVREPGLFRPRVAGAERGGHVPGKERAHQRDRADS